ECECCCESFSRSGMIHCNAEHSHWLCVDCAGRNAEEVIGEAQCDIRCMSMQPCGAGFPQEERRKFLDSNLSRALDRYELREILASADIESLSHCPFCDFAAIYPPIESAEEFHCQHPECGIISCRICHKKSHKPRSCISIARAQGRPTSLQRIQEAKSKALIRMCNKCGTPFVKEGGCHKMTCSVQECRNVQCYVCPENCDYSHFDD
ncbi:hypothetical protein BKA56DRAFT_438290, partial [Ilyonectria sp. MPI-CAGE-AT-0026]